MNKNRFINEAKPIVVTINGMPLQANPMEYCTGSVGYNLSGKVSVVLPDGTIGKVQVSGNLVVVGSKEWAEEAAA